MVDLNAFEFARTIQDGCDRSDLVLSYDVRILDNTVVKVRVVLIVDAFIDVFYNADTARCSYALIQNGERVFGADNAFVGWHLHPFDTPDKHVPASEVSFEEFLKHVEENMT